MTVFMISQESFFIGCTGNAKGKCPQIHFASFVNLHYYWKRRISPEYKRIMHNCWKFSPRNGWRVRFPVNATIYSGCVLDVLDD